MRINLWMGIEMRINSLAIPEKIKLYIKTRSAFNLDFNHRASLIKIQKTILYCLRYVLHKHKQIRFTRIWIHFSGKIFSRLNCRINGCFVFRIHNEMCLFMTWQGMESFLRRILFRESATLCLINKWRQLIRRVRPVGG